MKRNNGEGCVYKTKNGYRADIVLGYSINNKPIRKTHRCKTKKEALQWLAEVKVNPNVSSKTFAGLYKTFSNTKLKTLSSSKQTAYNIAFRRITPILNKEIKNVGIYELQSLVEDLTYYPARDIKNLLSHLYQLAIAENIVQNNLSRYIVLPQLEESEQIPFNEDEILTFWEAYNSGNSFVGYILFMIYTGAMPGELLQIKSENIDFENKVIIGAGLKTKKRKQTPIVLCDEIIPVVHSMLNGEKFFNGTSHNFYDTYNQTLKGLNVRKLPPYSCRHTTATVLAAANTNPLILKEIMRHAKITTTQKYVHLNNNNVLDTINAVQFTPRSHH